MSARLAFRDVACVRGGRALFEGLNFVLGPGEAALVTGPNGAGKSSLIRVAAGLLPAAAGRVECEGGRALLSETAALDPELSLAAALRFWARIDGRGDAVDAALEALRLADLAQVPVRLLSTGQRRRAALARVVASGAPLWLLDEPGNGLDTASVTLLEGLIAQHRAGGGIALVATHLPIALPDAIEVAL
ncbi:heme ABC exporter ATP-binding protein CcmA [Sphingomonas sp. M1-B02]|uniref:heme ABC exporter ATP-binding protein CcmA n=1 Tax=Sphingomonas sp. M1-B02 TaxID=3114300 RepID=UPI00223F7116|nr:heme ABC exporter ATP-binding protein CcmA [Sphingomonas sp. S6-11]UZK67962.1 heme ABC exporter ATP-binding protein CcmA [Sphingomonas sp. S6-11]